MSGVSIFLDFKMPSFSQMTFKLSMCCKLLISTMSLLDSSLLSHTRNPSICPLVLKNCTTTKVSSSRPLFPILIFKMRKGWLNIPVNEAGLKEIQQIVFKERHRLNDIKGIRLIEPEFFLKSYVLRDCIIKVIGLVKPGLVLHVSSRYGIRYNSYGSISGLVLGERVSGKNKQFARYLKETQITYIKDSTRVIQNQRLVARRIVRTLEPAGFDIQLQPQLQILSKSLLENRRMMDNYRAACRCLMGCLHKNRVVKDIRKLITEFVSPEWWRNCYARDETVTVRRVLETYKRLKNNNKRIVNIEKRIQKHLKLLADLPDMIEKDRQLKRGQEDQLVQDVRKLKRTKFY